MSQPRKPNVGSSKEAAVEAEAGNGNASDALTLKN